MHGLLYVLKNIVSMNHGVDKVSFLFSGLLWAFRKRIRWSGIVTLWNGISSA